MSQQTMAERQRVPAGVTPYAVVMLQGVLQEQPEVTELPGKRGDFCRAVIEVGDLDVAVIGKNKLAHDLADLPAGSGLSACGELGLYEWHTGTGRKATDSTRRQQAVLWLRGIDKLAGPVDTSVPAEDVP